LLYGDPATIPWFDLFFFAATYPDDPGAAPPLP